jgi:hypothetical protein
VEAYVRLGRREDAERVLGVFEASARHSGSPWATAAAARCRGLLAPGDAFDAPLSAALEYDGMPFETARTRLVLGERVFHLRNIYRKLGIRSRTELVRVMLSDG